MDFNNKLYKFRIGGKLVPKNAGNLSRKLQDINPENGESWNGISFYP